MATIQELLANAWHQYQQGQLDLARRTAGEALRREPLLAEALYLLGVVALDEQDVSEAIRLLQLAVGQASNNAAYHHALGEAWRIWGRSEAAIVSLNEALRLDPQLVAAHHALGLIRLDAGQLDEAAECFSRAIALRPDYQRAHNNLGRVRQAQGNLSAAAASLAEAVRLKPDDALAHNNLGAVLHAQGRPDAALASLQTAIRLKPDYPEAHFNLGNAHRSLGNHAAAEASYREAIRLRPDYAKAHNNLGLVLVALGRPVEALAAYQAAIRIQPDFADAHANLGSFWVEREDWGPAAAALRVALACDPEHQEARGNLIGVQEMTCDWSERDAQLARLWELAERQLASGKATSVTPFHALLTPWPAARQLAIARSHSAALEQRMAPLGASLNFTHPRAEGGRLRVGYLSADFHTHATMQLMQGLFGLHDRREFEIFAYSYGPADDSPARRRVVQDCEVFRDIRLLPDVECARQIHADGVQILVDLKGWTGHARTAIAALRPAPIQVNYLGYPGTMGADFIDYLIGDRVVTPPELADCFSERLVLLPHTYQVNDAQPIASTRQTRADHGLPETGFVFASFNNNYKIEPRIFDVWLRILAAVPGSVLWLFSRGTATEKNLRREAAARGSDPGRLVFARHVPKAEHLARQRLADLFLDTYYVNAHTTASDALWAGLPVLTCLGETFAARVAASLLTAVGLPELIAPDLIEYQCLAVRLAREPNELQALRDKLAVHRTTWPLFDTPRFTRNIERAYRTMWEIHAAVQPPRGFEVQET